MVARPNPSALSPGDAPVVEARKQAQASLSFFVEQMSAADAYRNRHFGVLVFLQPDGALAPRSVKAAPAKGKPASGQTFDLWLTVLKHQDGSFQCRVDQPRAELPTMKAGTSIDVKAADIHDWRITEDSGKLFGSFVLRQTLDQLPPEIRTATEAVLQPVPKSP